METSTAIDVRRLQQQKGAPDRDFDAAIARFDGRIEMGRIAALDDSNDFLVEMRKIASPRDSSETSSRYEAIPEQCIDERSATHVALQQAAMHFQAEVLECKAMMVDSRE